LDRAKYAEAELVENRVAVLLFGGTAAERQAWAEETAERLGGSATIVAAAESLPSALARKDGVVYVADALALGDLAQQQLLLCLQTQEERPKLVVAVQHGLESAFGGGGLRPDLHYRLRLAQVNLDEPGLRENIARRRSRRVLPRAAATRTATKRPAPRPASRAKPTRRRTPSKATGKRHKPRRAPAKRSRR